MTCDLCGEPMTEFGHDCSSKVDQATRLKVLDLFAGLRGWADPWAERGHETFTVDWDRRFDVDLHADVMQLEPNDLPWRPDVVLASPPCECFSVMRIGTNWTGPKDDPPHAPKTEEARFALALVERTLWLIRELDPAFHVIENPRAKLRRMPVMADLERRTVTYCQLGERRMKPTDLWGGFPPSLVLPEPCSNGDPCHVRAPRGSRTGTQGMDAAESARIPRALSLLVCEAAERDLAARAPAPRRYDPALVY